MNITNEKSTGLVQELKIEIVKGDYSEKIEDALKKQRKKAMIPGFRQGNAPIGMIRKMYYKNLLADEINRMVGEALYGYLRENNLEILLEPVPVDEKTTVDFDNSEDYTFVFEYALQPAFDIDFDKMPAISTFKVKASNKEIEEFISQLRKRHGQYITPEDIEFEDDFITIEYEEGKSGYFHSSDLSDKGVKAFTGKKLNDSLEISLREAFNDSTLLSRFLKIDEKELDAKNPYKYNVKITSIGRITPAEINEDFFKKAFADESVKNEKELKQRAASEIEKTWDEETNRHFMNEAIGALLDNVKIDFPDDFVKRFILLSQEGMTQETLDEKYGDYKKSFIWQLIENKLGKEHNLNVSNDEVKEYIRNFFVQNYFAQFNQDEIADRLDTLVNDALKNKEDVKRIYDTLYDKKIEEILRSNLKINETTGDHTEFITFVTGEKPEKPAKKKAPAKAKNVEEEVQPKTKAKKTTEAENEEKKKPATKKTKNQE